MDGVALKQAVDAWVSAPAAEQAVRFANAETIRWLEWGVRSYHSCLLGLALVLFGTAMIGTARAPRLLGGLTMVSGGLYLVQGVVLGSQGFSSANTVPQLLGYLLIVIWSSWLLHHGLANGARLMPCQGREWGLSER